MKTLITTLIMAGVLSVGCAGAKAWVVPMNLQEGSADKMVREASDAGKLRDLMIAAEEQLFDSDEMRFAEFLRAALASGQLSESEAETAEWMLHDVCELNSPGRIAADFEFDTPDSKNRTLREFLPGENLVLIIYDPDCSSCKTELQKLDGLGSEVAVLAVCVEASEDRWVQTRDLLPSDWIKAFDRSGIIYNDDYVIRSMPGIYLLNGEREVILKHPKAERLLEYFKK